MLWVLICRNNAIKASDASLSWCISYSALSVQLWCWGGLKTWFDSQVCNIILCDLEKHHSLLFSPAPRSIFCLCNSPPPSVLQLHQHLIPIRTSSPFIFTTTYHFHSLFSLNIYFKLPWSFSNYSFAYILNSLAHIFFWHTCLAKPQI